MGPEIMKSILESSIYLILMSMICLFSMDFVGMNMCISNVGQIEQYVEDYIELNGIRLEDNSLDDETINAVNKTVSDKGMSFSYTYMDSTYSHAYYKIQLKYKVKSLFFNMGKTHTFDGIARVDI